MEAVEWVATSCIGIPAADQEPAGRSQAGFGRSGVLCFVDEIYASCLHRGIPSEGRGESRDVMIRLTCKRGAWIPNREDRSRKS